MTRIAPADDAEAPVESNPRPPATRVRPVKWVRDNLFSTWYNTLLTVVFAPLASWVLYRVGRFVFADARWEIIERNLRLFLVFRFPGDELWRLWIALFVMAASFGLAAGAAVTVRAAEVARGTSRPAAKRVALRRAGPLIVLLAVLLWLAGSLRALLLVAGVIVVGVAFRHAGQRLPHRYARWTGIGAAVGVLVALVVVIGFGGVGWSDWGGLMLTLWLAVGGIVISFPFGVLLALGRRSSLPVVRVVCVTYIELIRAVPLITLLFMGLFVIGLFLPPGFATPSAVTRALIAIVLFTSGYVAEIVRGGIQSIPTGQFEAARALGLSPYKTTRLIVLPQALRTVIPALVGQFISLFKDTSLVFIIGLSEILRVAETVRQQPDFLAQGLIFETLVFVSFVYWAGSYSMSRESQRLEQRLGVGKR